MTSEEVVQAALTVERWCKKNFWSDGKCDCPFAEKKMCWFFDEDMPEFPYRWGLENYLRTRGLKDESGAD